MSHYVVTGAAGFIGSHLVERLLHGGHRVTGIDNLFTGSRGNLPASKHFEFVRHDVCEPWHIENDGIFHLACPASPAHYQRNPVRTIKTGVMGTITALECARDSNSKIVIASTSEVYGDPEQHPQKEEYWGHANPVGSRSCYDESKRCAESMSMAWSQQYGVVAAIARLFNCYGPNMASGDGRLLPNLITQALHEYILTVHGDGKQTRSFCYVDDTVDALVRMMDVVQETVVINIGNPDERTILSVAEDVKWKTGSPAHIVFKSLPEDDPRRRCPDITRAKKILNWAPRTPFEDGLQKTINYFKSVQ